MVSRNTLKKYFDDGARPTRQHFEALIDSTLNIPDDGFSKTPKNGIQVRPIGDYRRVLSFFGRSQNEPEWSIGFDRNGENLNFLGTVTDPAQPAPKEPPEGEQAQVARVGIHSPVNWTAPLPPPNTQTEERPDTEVVTLTKEGNVGIRVADPACRLDVDGTVRSRGRLGQPGWILADGKWHAITEVLTGCHAFEVVAGVGLAHRKKGRYAMMHAHALNTFNPTGLLDWFFPGRRGIQCTHAWYLSRGDKLRLRWTRVEGEPHQYQLAMKSVSSYMDNSGQKDVRIRFWISELWFDPTMDSSIDYGEPKP
jgi:hypothetical protein